MKRAVLFLYWLVFILPAHLAMFLLPLGILINPDWAERVGRAMLDVGFNCAWLNGSPRQTVSAHAGDEIIAKGVAAPKWALFVAWLTNKFEPNHVLDAAKQETLP